MVVRRDGRGRLALAVLVCLASCARTPEAERAPALVGAWQSNVQFRGGVLAPIQDLSFLYVFNAGGTMTESSNYDGAPPVPPAYGEWRRTGDRTFEAKYTFFTTAPPSDMKSLASGGGWGPAGSGVLTERITLAADGRSFASTITLAMFDRAGKPVSGGGEATAEGRRTGF